jgi:pyruvate formate lyase activating enzyme
MAYRKLPLVAEIKRNSLDDGPGIRSVVFFKGCVLNCVWCHNPECIGSTLELMQLTESCLGCGDCADTCPQEALTFNGHPVIDRDKCDCCGECALACPADSLKLVGRKLTARNLANELAEDLPFFANSGGGVTLSGGEPTLFMAYCTDLARELKSRGIHICLETCGNFDWKKFEPKLLPLLDLVYIDLKLIDEAEHKKYTGKTNRKILANISNLIESDIPEFLVRIPLIPGVNTSKENLVRSAKWLKAAGINRIALLPYNPTWINKANGIAHDSGYSRDTFMSEVEEEQAKEIFSDFDQV